MALHSSYHGEKLVRNVVNPKVKQGQRQVVISTVYDKPDQRDLTEPLLRSREPDSMKWRDEVKFVRSSVTKKSNPRP